MALVPALVALLLLLAEFAHAASAAPLEAYARLPAIERAALSSSGARFALIEVVDGARRLVVHETGEASSADPLLILDLGAEKVRAIDWAGEDLILVSASVTTSLGMEFAVSRREIMQVSVASVSRRSRSHLFRSPNLFGGVFGSHGAVQQGGRWYGHFEGMELEGSLGSTERRFPARSPDLLRVDLATGAVRVVATGSEGRDRRDWAVSGDGRVAATLDFWSGDGRWRLRSGTSGKVIASGVNPLGDVDLVGRGRKPGTILYRFRDRSGEDHWIEADDSGSAAELFAGEEVAAIWTNPVSQLLIGYTSEGVGRRERFFGETLEKRARAARGTFAASNIEIKSHDVGFERLILHTNGPQDSGRWWLFHPRTGSLRSIGRSYPGIAPGDVGSVRSISWRAADGLVIEGVLTLPPGTVRPGLPLVVLPHGGPTARDYPVFDWWAQAFASRGYAVLQPNFRGSSGYGPAFREAGKREWGRKMQSDISGGIAELAQHGVIDRGRVCIMGGSYGGYAALAGVTLQRGLYRCAVSVAGVSDLPKLFQYDRLASGGSPTVLRAWRGEIGQPAELSAISPARHAARADAPILLIHGRDDTVVPIEQSRIMAKRLRRSGKPVQLLELPGEDHWLSREATRKAMLSAAVAFVERHNPPQR